MMRATDFVARMRHADGHVILLYHFERRLPA